MASVKKVLVSLHWLAYDGTQLLRTRQVYCVEDCKFCSNRNVSVVESSYHPVSLLIR